MKLLDAIKTASELAFKEDADQLVYQEYDGYRIAPFEANDNPPGLRITSSGPDYGELEGLWTINEDKPLFLVLDEHGENVEDAKLIWIDSDTALYVDEKNGFELISREDANKLNLTKAEA